MVKIDPIARKVLGTALEKWGHNSQLIMSLEEMSELSVEIAKSLNGRTNPAADPYAIASEVADVLIMMLQLRETYGELVDKQIRLKLARLAIGKLKMDDVFPSDFGLTWDEMEVVWPMDDEIRQALKEHEEAFRKNPMALKALEERATRRFPDSVSEESDPIALKPTDNSRNSTKVTIIFEVNGNEHRVVIDGSDPNISSLIFTHIPTFITISPESGLTALTSESYELEVTYREMVML